jgi:hypothetical protein
MYPYLSRAFQRYQEHGACPNTMKPTQCTSSHQELSNDTKSLTKSPIVLRDLKVANKTNKLPSLIDTIEPGLGLTLIILFSKMLIIFKKIFYFQYIKKFVEGK